MDIMKIEVQAGRTFNHPFEQFSNLRCDVRMIAHLQPDDDPDGSARALQAKAEKLVEDHKQYLLRTIRELAELSDFQREFVDLEARMKDAQARMDALRQSKPQMFEQLQLSETNGQGA